VSDYIQVTLEHSVFKGQLNEMLRKIKHENDDKWATWYAVVTVVTYCGILFLCLDDL